MGIHYKVFSSFLHHWGHFQLPFHSVGLQQCLRSSAFGALAAAPSLLPPSASIYLLVPDISGPGKTITVQTRKGEDLSSPQQRIHPFLNSSSQSKYRGSSWSTRTTGCQESLTAQSLTAGRQPETSCTCPTQLLWIACLPQPGAFLHMGLHSTEMHFTGKGPVKSWQTLAGEMRG